MLAKVGRFQFGFELKTAISVSVSVRFSDPERAASSNKGCSRSRAARFRAAQFRATVPRQTFQRRRRWARSAGARRR